MPTEKTSYAGLSVQGMLALAERACAAIDGAFFCGQFVAWFSESGLGTILAIRGIEILSSWNLPRELLVVAVIFLTASLNLFIGSASAKWFLLAPVFVPLFLGLGVSPELTQAAYRVGDSTTKWPI